MDSFLNHFSIILVYKKYKKVDYDEDFELVVASFQKEEVRCRQSMAIVVLL